MEESRTAEAKSTINDKFKAFLRAADAQDLDELGQFLSTKPERESLSPLLPIDEMEERLQLIIELEQYWRQNFSRLTQKPQDQWKPFTNLEMAALIIMDLGNLRLIRRLKKVVSEGILNAVCKMPSLIKILLAKPETPDDTARANLISPTSPSKAAKLKRSDSDDSFESDPTQFDANGTAKRNAGQAQKRRNIDKDMCIVLKTADPEVCHILPHSTNKTEERRSKVESYIHHTEILLFADSQDGQGDLAKQLFARKPGCSDRKWNMVCLNPMLHKWWGDFRFGLKFLGTGPPVGGMTSLKLQWHWMLRRDGNPTSPLPRTKEKFIGAFRGNYGDATGEPPFYSAARPDLLRRIRTGDIFHVPIHTELADKAILAFKMQWAVINMVAIAGGAAALELVDDEPPEYFDEASGCFVGFAAEFRESYEDFLAFTAAKDVEDFLATTVDKGKALQVDHEHAGPSGRDGGNATREGNESLHDDPTASDDGGNATREDNESLHDDPTASDDGGDHPGPNRLGAPRKRSS